MIQPQPSSSSASSSARDRDGGPTGELALTLRVTDREMCEALAAVAEGPEREAHALHALQIGLLALRTAQGRIDADAVRREGDAILAELRMALNGHREGLRAQVEETWKRYFDPESGALDQRLKGLIARDGELEGVLQRQVGLEGSALAETLRAHFGPESEIMRRLSPSDAEGLFQKVTSLLETQLRGQRDQLLQQFSLDADDSALSRLVGRLAKSNDALGEDLTGKVDTLLGELSLDQEQSGLKRMRDELMSVLTRHGRAEAEFRAQVLSRLGKLEGEKETSARTTLRGLDFEQALFETVRARAEPAGDVAELTVNTVGKIRNSKVGDIVLELGPESAAPGARIVIEAKEVQRYTFAQAREEIETARKNRGAGFGIFVFSHATAPEGMGPFQRLGSDVFVIWDAADPDASPWLEAGLAVARALAVQRGRDDAASDVDLDGLERAILEIEKRSASLDEIRKSAQTVVSAGEKIQDRVRISRDALARQVRTLQGVLDTLRG